jgi:hypothetical protein
MCRDPLESGMQLPASEQGIATSAHRSEQTDQLEEGGIDLLHRFVLWELGTINLFELSAGRDKTEQDR